MKPRKLIASSFRRVVVKQAYMAQEYDVQQRDNDKIDHQTMGDLRDSDEHYTQTEIACSDVRRYSRTNYFSVFQIVAEAPVADAEPGA